MAWKKRSWRKKNAQYMINKEVDSILIFLIIIYVFLYQIIVTYWMWLLLLLMIGVIGWIYLRKDNYTIQYIKGSQQIMGNPEKSNYSSLNTDEVNHVKGFAFEKYVANLFDPGYFIINDWTRDSFDILQRPVESDQNPDLTMRYNPTKELFSVECKFRSSAYNDKVNWARDDQIKNYLSYAAKNRIPTYVVIGLGGSPDNPNKMFCVPIEDAKYPELFLSMLRNYERSPSEMFYWKNGKLN